MVRIYFLELLIKYFRLLVEKPINKLLFIIIPVIVLYGLTISISDCASNYVPIDRIDIGNYLSPYFNRYYMFDTVAFNIDDKTFLCPKVYAKYLALLKWCAPEDFKLLMSSVIHVSSITEFTNNYILFFEWYYSFVKFFSTKGLIFLRDANTDALHFFIQNKEWELYYKALLDCFNDLNNKS